LPFGVPLSARPRAPCIRQTAQPLTAGDRLSLAQSGCFNDGGKAPRPLVGRLSERSSTSYKQLAPAVSERFYILDLDKPTCLTRADGSTIANIRSVHVYAKEEQGAGLLRQHRNKRVTVRLINVFEEHTAHHRRPMVGEIETVMPFP
jgi:hypothetical protein